MVTTNRPLWCTDKQNALMRNCNGKVIEWIEGQHLEVVVYLYFTFGCIAERK